MIRVQLTYTDRANKYILNIHVMYYVQISHNNYIEIQTMESVCDLSWPMIEPRSYP